MNDANSPRVLLADENKGFGGAERHVLTLGRALADQGSLSALAARSNSWLADHCQELPFHSVGFRNEVDMLSVYNLYRKLKSDKINVLHCIGHRDFVAASLARNLPGAPQTVLIKAEHSYPDKNLSPLFRWAYGQCHAITTVSTSLKHALTEAINLKPEVRVEVIPNGIEIPDTAASPRDISPLHIGVLSPMRPGKGLSDFLKAASVVAENNQASVRFSIAGDGELRSQLEQEARDLKLEIDFRGHLEDPSSYLRELSLSVVPSHRETFSLVTLESMVVGLPLVAADSEGVAELCSSHPGATLYPSGDVAALGQAISEFIQEPESLLKGATECLKAVQTQYSSQAMATRYLNLYKELLA